MTPTTPVNRRPADRRPVAAPDAGHLAGMLVRTWSEVLQGRRSFAQISAVLSPALRMRLAEVLATMRWQAPPPLRVLRVVTCKPNPHACEASVVVGCDDRVTAVAVRLERHRGAWRVVELTAPEAGRPALTTSSLPHGARDSFDDVLDAESAPDSAELDEVRLRGSA